MSLLFVIMNVGIGKNTNYFFVVRVETNNLSTEATIRKSEGLKLKK